LTGTYSDPNGVQYSEKQNVRCVATGGTFTLSFRGVTTTAIPFNANVAAVKAAIDSISTISSSFHAATEVLFMDDAVACRLSGNDIRVTFLQDFDDLPMLVGNANRLSTPTPSITPPSLVISEVDTGTRESAACSGRGTCDSGNNGVCDCALNFGSSDGAGDIGRRGDCGHPLATITTCPGEISCSGHGNCAGSPTYVCSCSIGYTGADCSLRTCPEGKAWFAPPTGDETAHTTTLAECSAMGICNRNSGECDCADGFEGADCGVTKCPGFTPCNDRGSCLTMGDLAAVARTNGVDSGFTYGEIPNLASTWDHDMMRGCACDYPFTGFDCGLQNCPYGDDPYTRRRQNNEIHTITCVDPGDGSGTFKLKFRESTTASISILASGSDVEDSLEALSSDLDFDYLDVTVYTDIGIESESELPVCTNGGEFHVEFLYPNGDLPIMSIVEATGVTLTISEEEKGTTEWRECSLRGLCDRALGECVCFSGFGASDGQGNEGAIANCGHVRPNIG